jgi:alpha-tubulin suppressor-like RCC1 family protein
MARCRLSVAGGAAVAELVLSPTKALVAACTSAACGAEFTMWLCEGKLYSAGCPQYGQLGHGTDHEYNAKDCESPCCLALSSPAADISPSSAEGLRL